MPNPRPNPDNLTPHTPALQSALTRQHLFRRDCPNGRFTRWRGAVFQSCCATPERLLSYAVHVGRQALDVSAAPKEQALLHVPEGIFVPSLHNLHMNILRSLYVCGLKFNTSTDLMADVRAGRSGLELGLGLGLGLRLRLRVGVWGRVSQQVPQCAAALLRAKLRRMLEGHRLRGE